MRKIILFKAVADSYRENPDLMGRVAYQSLKFPREQTW